MSADIKRMLFVDDEAVILQGLERMLFEMADEWDMVFVDKPERALSVMDDSHFDVIISDARMPGMDGATLLGHVQARHPDAVRILLTGYSELETTLRAMPVVHRYLTKPCKPAVLVDVLRRSCALQTLLPLDLRVLVGSVSGLPVTPEVYALLTAAINDPSVEASAIARIARRDVALSGKILHLANSAFLGTRHSSLNVEQAVEFIGVRMLRELVLSAQVFKAFEAETTIAGFAFDALQRHARICAAIARAIAGDSERAELAFIGGLLHDVGKLVLASHGARLPPPSSAPRALFDRPTPEVLALDPDALHGRVGAYLLGLWGMDDALVQAVAHHHDPAALGASSLDLATIVHVANALAHELESERAGQGSPSALDTAHLERRGLLGRVAEWRAHSRHLLQEQAL
jgi:HD-like signal output (HDOD) protein/ActR/RegA family two-component response regulator